MIERLDSIKYPTRKGVSISPLEIYSFNESQLDLESPRNWNLHHSEWTRRQFGRNILMLTFRQIETNQLFMPVDIHDKLHREYEPPVMPTPIQAITEIERAKDAGERLQIRQPAKKIGKYTLELITDEVFLKCKASYDSLKHRG